MMSISIHTPTKGVTLIIAVILYKHYISIHTPTKGVTKDREIEPPQVHDFNPHSHEGSDYDQQEYINSFADISIHTPTKGVT